MPTIFEKLLSGELPCAKVYEDELVFAFMDAGQVNDGHVIVATRAPRATLLDCTDAEAGSLMRTARRVALAVQAAFAPEGITVLPGAPTRTSFTRTDARSPAGGKSARPSVASVKYTRLPPIACRRQVSPAASATWLSAPSATTMSMPP